jgi:hypothetical protein
LAWTGAATTAWQCEHSGLGLTASYRHQLTKLWLNIALQSCN